MGKNLPPRVFVKSGRYYHVRAEGSRRIWTALSRVRDGYPALYRSLAGLEAEAVADDRMPAVIQSWQRDVMIRHSEQTQKADAARCAIVSKAFAEFRARDVQAPDVSTFLRQFTDRRRTHNCYRSLVRELMRYSIEMGYRTDNPVDALRTLPTPPRTRYPTDSEVRRIKVAAIRGADGRPTASGRMIAAMIDLLYLTGQRPSDVLDLRWQRDRDEPDAPHVCEEGLRFRPSKTAKSTAALVLIQWTPRLRDAVERIRRLQAERLLKKRADQRIVSGWLITTVSGTKMSYWGASSAWQRAVERAKVRGIQLRDLRAKALTDTEKSSDMKSASAMGAHSTEQQTSDYVRRRSGRSVRATR